MKRELTEDFALPSHDIQARSFLNLFEKSTVNQIPVNSVWEMDSSFKPFPPPTSAEILHHLSISREQFKEADELFTVQGSVPYEEEEEDIICWKKQPPAEIRTRTKTEPRSFTVAMTVDASKLLPLLEKCLGVETCQENSEVLVKLSLVFLDQLKGVSATENISEDPTAERASRAKPRAKTTIPLTSVLGGTIEKRFRLQGDVNVEAPVPFAYHVIFDDLSLKVASLKFNEREFCIRAELLVAQLGDSPCLERLSQSYSAPFYGYSHKNVLNRRKDVRVKLVSPETVYLSSAERQTLDALNLRETGLASVMNDDHGSSQCSQVRMHIIGQPFISSSKLSIVIAVPHSSSGFDGFPWNVFKARNIEFFSETVLFFDSPTISELEETFSINSDILTRTENESFLPGYVFVSNDGKNYSNAVPITFALHAQLARNLSEPISNTCAKSEISQEDHDDMSIMSLSSLEIDLDELKLVPRKRLKMISKM